MKLHNTLTRQTEELIPLRGNSVRIYSCGPTVYDHIHIGNLSAFVYADTLRRVIKSAGYDVSHVMNFTDVDDKTINRSRDKYPNETPETALRKLTQEYSEAFLDDMKLIGNDVESIEFINATDSIDSMRELIIELYKEDFAYIAEDGIYFSIQKYRDSGKKYGQLIEISEASTSEARIQNDEYDKESAHDFALWKKKKEGEPSWEFELDGHDLSGRPGWHIECSAMSVAKLGQPFDIHTGGIDLIFPHHENEIAQSTTGASDMYAKLFFHNEHLLVDGKKMSKSLNNFFTLQDIRVKGYDPMAFRLMVLQSHYRSQSNFTWENLEAAQNRLRDLRAVADLRFQENAGKTDDKFITLLTETLPSGIISKLQDDINTPEALAFLSTHLPIISAGYHRDSAELLTEFFRQLDDVFGLELCLSKDISDEQKQIIQERKKARDAHDWSRSDELRDELESQGISVRDTESGPIWFRN